MERATAEVAVTERNKEYTRARMGIPVGGEIVRTWVYLGDPTLQLVPLQPGSRCDVNGDGKIDLADLQLLIYVILGQAPCPGNCDINRDFAVNLLDFQALANVILGKSPCP